MSIRFYNFVIREPYHDFLQIDSWKISSPNVIPVTMNRKTFCYTCGNLDFKIFSFRQPQIHFSTLPLPFLCLPRSQFLLTLLVRSNRTEADTEIKPYCGRMPRRRLAPKINQIEVEITRFVAGQGSQFIRTPRPALNGRFARFMKMQEAQPQSTTTKKSRCDIITP